jgi:hypothetical protein
VNGYKSPKKKKFQELLQGDFYPNITGKFSGNGKSIS